MEITLGIIAFSVVIILYFACRLPPIPEMVPKKKRKRNDNKRAKRRFK